MGLLYFHLGFMSAACASMIAAIAAARFFRKRKWWLKVHRAWNTVSVGLMLVGLVLAVIMVGTNGETPEGAPHRTIGGISVFVALALFVAGNLIFRLKDKETVAGLKKAHRWTGRAEALVFPATIIVGLLLIGVL